MRTSPTIFQAEEAPQSPSILHLTNGTTTAVVCPPDPVSGYYRATRFDWSGVLSDLRGRGHRYVTPWKNRHDPLCHDDLSGPVDEFTEIGYERARPGEEFLKIGVGMLRRYSGEPYDRFRLYEIVNHGLWETTATRDRVEFRHRLLSDEYGYDYRKELRLPHTDRLRIDYTLKNLGPAVLAGQVCNHNFFTLDRMVTGPDTAIRFPFHPVGTWREAYDCVTLGRDGIRFNRELRPGETVFMGDLHAQDSASGTYGFCILNLLTGAGIRVSGNAPLSHMVLWARRGIACIEPYTTFRAFPGETLVWRLEYELLA